MADIKKLFYFWQMLSGSIKKYCCNIKIGLSKIMLLIVLIRCLRIESVPEIFGSRESESEKNKSAEAAFFAGSERIDRKRM
ncbi:hypothetical protein [Catenibacterium sp.]|uniref:hypothetical protein n=1 Tax=Catenibacterium sp. TaxID=2049022 RepID=UPI0040276AB6